MSYLSVYKPIPAISRNPKPSKWSSDQMFTKKPQKTLGYKPRLKIPWRKKTPGSCATLQRDLC